MLVGDVTCVLMAHMLLQGKVVWQGSSHEFDTTDSPIVKQFRTGDLGGPIRFD